MSIESIEEIYHAFRRVPKRIKILGCTHCCTTEEELKALEKGVREAPRHAVKTLAHNGISTVGNGLDYKYFLPRILHEFYLDFDFFNLCIDALTTRIQMAGFEDWRDVEKQATLTGLEMVFSQHCQKLSMFGLMDWLYGVAVVDFDITKFLDVLDYPENELQKLELVLDYLVHFRSKANGKVKLSHGYLTSAQYDPIYRWVAESV